MRRRDDVAVLTGFTFHRNDIAALADPLDQFLTKTIHTANEWKSGWKNE